MAASQPQDVTSLAFNIHLFAYDYQLPNRDQRQVLAVQRCPKDMKINGFLTSGNDVRVPSLTPTAAELLLKNAEHIVVWVGMRPSTAMDYAKGVSAGKTSHNAGGIDSAKNPFAPESVNSVQNYTTLAFDPDALRVICPIGKKTANYYNLVNQADDALCMAYHTPIKEVFFFAEFRDDKATSVQKRLSHWAKIVRGVCSGQPDGGNAPQAALGNDNCTETSRSPAVVEQNVSLHQLVRAERIASIEECESVLEELHKLAPVLGSLGITTKEVQKMSAVLCNGKVKLEHSAMPLFTAVFMGHLRAFKWGSDPAKIATEIDHYFQPRPKPVSSTVEAPMTNFKEVLDAYHAECDATDAKKDRDDEDGEVGNEEHMEDRKLTVGEERATKKLRTE